MSSSTFTYAYSGAVRQYLDAVSELLAKLFRRGVMILTDLPGAAVIDERTSAIVLLYRHATALLDAFSQLSGVPSVEGLRVVFRSFFEAKCSIEYIVESNVIDRAVAYQTQHILRRIGLYEKLDSTTQPGKEFQSRLSKDRLFGSTAISHVDTKAAIDNLQAQLQREPFKTSAAKLGAKKGAKWYSIDGGPKDFIGLCEHLNYQIAYDYLYRQLSESVHATGAYVDTYFGQKGQGQMHAIRAIAGYQDLVNLALPLIVDFFDQTTKTLLPIHHDRFVRFYKNIYHPFRVKNIDNIKVERA